MHWDIRTAVPLHPFEQSAREEAVGSGEGLRQWALWMDETGWRCVTLKETELRRMHTVTANRPRGIGR